MDRRIWRLAATVTGRSGVRLHPFRADNGPTTIGADAVLVEDKRVKVPKIGWVRMRERVRFRGQIKSLIISLHAGRWYASISVDTQDLLLPTADSFDEEQGVVGVDLGSHALATLSSGDSSSWQKVLAPKPYKASALRLKRAQRSLSRKVKGSLNRRKAKWRVQKLHARIGHLREESLHQLSHQLTKRFNVIAIEDLNVKGMMKNHCLAGTIADLGFYELRRQLQYKGSRRGVQIVVADRWFPSSKLCSVCGHKYDGLTLSQRSWTCPSCATTHDRDVNAAQNLRRYAILQQAAQEDSALQAIDDKTRSASDIHSEAGPSFQVQLTAGSSSVAACGEFSSGRKRKPTVKLGSVKQEFNSKSTISRFASV